MAQHWHIAKFLRRVFLSLVVSSDPRKMFNNLKFSQTKYYVIEKIEVFTKDSITLTKEHPEFCVNPSLTILEAAAGGVLLLKFCKFHRKTPVLESLFNKVSGRQACIFIKKRLQHRYFPVKFAKVLTTPLLKNISKRLLPYLISECFEQYHIDSMTI